MISDLEEDHKRSVWKHAPKSSRVISSTSLFSRGLPFISTAKAACYDAGLEVFPFPNRFEAAKLAGSLITTKRQVVKPGVQAGDQTVDGQDYDLDIRIRAPAATSLSAL